MLAFSVCFRASESLQSVLWHSRRTSFSFISVAQLTLYRFRCLCGSFQVVSLLKKISHKLNCTGLVPCLNFILYQTIMIDAGVSTQAPSDSMREVYKGNSPYLGNSPYVGSYIGASGLWTVVFCLFHGLRPSKPKLDALPPLSPSCGMSFLPLYV